MERKFVKSRKAQKAVELRLSANVSLQQETLTKTQLPSQPLPDVSLLQLADLEDQLEKQSVRLLADRNRSSESREQSEREDIFLVPADDFKLVVRPRELSTVVNPAKVCPELTQTESCFVKECVDFYKSDYSSVQFKYASLSGSYFSVLLHTRGAAHGGSGTMTGDERRLFALPIQKFELDEDLNPTSSLSSASKESHLLKQGFLWKTPFNKKGDKSFFTKNAFKRRYFSLQQLPDGSYALNYWKDERKDNLKGSLNLEGCLSASKLPSSSNHSSSSSSGGGKFVIELHFVSKQVLQVAADKEGDQEDWTDVLQRAITASNSVDTLSCSNQSVGTADDESYNSDLSDMSTDLTCPQSQPKTPSTIASSPSSGANNLTRATPANHKSKYAAPLGPGPTRDPNLGSDIQRFCKETDRSVAEARRKDRLSLFSVFADLDCEQNSHLEVEDTVKFHSLAHLTPPFQSDEDRDTGLNQIVVSVEKLDFPLKVAQDGSKLYNMEPFFVALALYDVQSGCKVSEDVWVDGNPAPVWKMIKHDDSFSPPSSQRHSHNESRPHIVESARVLFPKDVLFSVPKEFSLDNLVLYVRIEKVLQGAISSSFDVYGKTGIDQENKSVQKYLKQLHMFCQKFGSKFRTVLCWAALPLSALLESESAEARQRVDAPLMRSDQSKMGLDCLKRSLVDVKTHFNRPEKLASRFGVLPDASISCSFRNLKDLPPDSVGIVNPFLVLKKSGGVTSKKENAELLVREACIFRPFDHTAEQPYSEYVNTMFVNQMHLKYDSQKVFAKARNIACSVKFLSNDSCQCPAASCIYSPVLGQSCTFTDQYVTAISHHNESPEFQDEVKIELPAELTSAHHILFTFYHISCDQVAKLTSSSSATVGKKSGNNMSTVESNVGYAWINLATILEKGVFKDSSGTIEFATSVPVAVSVVPGYLSSELDTSNNLQLGSSSEISPTSSSNSTQKLEKIKFLDGGKALFSFCCKVKSSVVPHSKFLKNLFEDCHKESSECRDSSSQVDTPDNRKSCETLTASPESETEKTVTKGFKTLLNVKAAHAIDENELVAYLPVILNKVLRLLTESNCDVQINIMRFIVHVASTLNKQTRLHLLTDYIRHVFSPCVGRSSGVFEGHNQSSGDSVHDRVVASLVSLLSFTSGDEFFYTNLLTFLNIFFDIVIKSMALSTLRLRKLQLPRGAWFSESFQDILSQLVGSVTKQISERSRSQPRETAMANRSLAFFLKSLLSTMHRGRAMELIKLYWAEFAPFTLADGRGLVTLRIEFLNIVTNHEHFLQLSLPVLSRKSVTGSVWNKDVSREFSLSEDFFNRHFLAALPLGEVWFDLADMPKVRSASIVLLRNLLAKLSLDPRLQSENAQAVVCSLFVPLVRIVVHSVSRLTLTHSSLANSHSSFLLNSFSSPHWTRPAAAALSRSVSTESLSDTVFSSCHAPSVDHASHYSHKQQNQSSTSVVSPIDSRKSSVATVRFDSLDGQETRNLLLSFLHVLKHSSAGPTTELLTQWWDYSSDQQQSGFLTALKVCLDCFQYDPNKSFGSHQRSAAEEDVLLSGLSGKGSALKGDLMTGSVKLTSSRTDGGVTGDTLLERAQGQRPKTMTLTMAAFGEGKSDRSMSVSMGDCGGGAGGGSTVVSSLKEANLAVETGLVVLDTVDSVASHLRKRVEALQSASVTLVSLFEIYLAFLTGNHSQTLLQQTFASLRLLISKFPMVLFKGEPVLCGRLCFELIRCFSARLESTRYHSCMLLYLLMRSNFIFTARHNCTRVHLQSIVAVSQLVTDVSITTSPRFQESLALLNNMSASDRGMTHTRLPSMVNELTKTIRKVLIATSQMQEHEQEPEMLMQLQHSLADSYAGTPTLRQTWLESMARIHAQNQYYSEAAMCYLHIAAMHAEYLKSMGQAVGNPIAFSGTSHHPSVAQKSSLSDVSTKKISISGALHANTAANSLSIATPSCQPNATAVSNFAHSLVPTGKALFRDISANIEEDERAVLEDRSTSSAQDDSFSQDMFVKLLERALDNLWLAQRYELVPRVIQLMLPHLDRMRLYDRLVELHQQCSNSYLKMMEVYSSGKRFLATYFRVAFHGKIFGPDEGQQYIYKEPNVTSLATISQRLTSLYTDKFGSENFKFLHDSDLSPKNLDPKMGYLQVTHVEPYLEELEQLKGGEVALGALTDFDMHHNVNKFVFEAPFTRPSPHHYGTGSGSGSGAEASSAGDASSSSTRHAAQLNEQYIRKIILRTKQAFPYVEKRVLVEMVQSFELSPIEVACEALKRTSVELKLILNKRQQADMKRLQLKLQGAIGTQVNAGPMAYAKAFLQDERQYAYAANKVKQLKLIYIDFVSTCADALELNGKLIKADQYEFHENLKLSFKSLVEKLAAILKMDISDKGTLEWSMAPVATALASDSPTVSANSRKSSAISNASANSPQSHNSAGRRNSTKVLTEISRTNNSDTFR